MWQKDIEVVEEMAMSVGDAARGEYEDALLVFDDWSAIGSGRFG